MGVMCSNILLLILFFSFNENFHSFHFYLKHLNNEDWHFREYKGEMVIFKSRLRTSGRCFPLSEQATQMPLENGERPPQHGNGGMYCMNVIASVVDPKCFFYPDPPSQTISDPDPDPVSYPALYKLL